MMMNNSVNFLSLDQKLEILPGVVHDEIIVFLETHADAVINLHSGYTKLYPRLTNLYQTR